MSEKNNNNLTKFEQQFLSEFLNDIEKREDSSWSKPWDYISVQNAFTEHEYSGMNQLYLTLLLRNQNIEDPRFATFNQARKNGYYIKKGSKGIPIQFFQFIDKRTGKQWNEKEFRKETQNMTAKQRLEISKNRIPISKSFHVFNAENIINRENQLSLSENIPFKKNSKKINTNELIDKFENILIKNMKIGYKEVHSSEAYYTPSLDTVTMPEKEQFNSYEERIAVLLHELGHATGHEDRLNRNLSTSFSSSEYSVEEVRVELNSVFMTNTLGLEITDEQKTNHLKYLDGWGKIIKNQPKEFLRTLSDSLKIKDYMIDKGNYEELFIEKEDTLNIFKEALNVFASKEYNTEFTDEDIVNMTEQQGIPIAYTTDEDPELTFYYERQIYYDLENEKLINSINNGTIEFLNKEDMPLEEMVNNLNNASFDDFIAQYNMGINIDEADKVVVLATLYEDTAPIESYLDSNNLETANELDLSALTEQKNHILRIVNKEFFDKNNIEQPNNFIFENEFKQLIDFQSVHHEKIERVSPIDLVYKKNIESELEGVRYSNYRELWEDNFKNRFIDDLKNFTLVELETNQYLSSSPDLINKLNTHYKDVSVKLHEARKFEKLTKDKDIDGDGIPDRLDPNSNRTSIRDVTDIEEEATKSIKEDIAKQEQKTRVR